MLPLSVQQHSKKEMEQYYKEVTDALGIYDLSQNIQMKYLVVNNNVLQLHVHLYINLKSFSPMNLLVRLTLKVHKIY